jgi:ATP-binding cassette subfamily C protein
MNNKTKSRAEAYSMDNHSLSKTLQFIRFFFTTYPRRSLLMVLALVASGLAEGLGIVSLIPVLEMFTSNENGQSLLIGEAVRGTLRSIGIEPTLGVLLTMLVFSSILKSGFIWMSVRQVGYTIANVTSDLRLRLLEKLMQARWGYFVTQPVGSLSNALGWETAKAANAYKQVGQLLAGVINVSVYIVIAFFVSWKVVAVSLVAGTLFMYLLKGMVRLSRKSGSNQARVMKTLSSRFVDALHGIKPIKAMGREKQLWNLLEDETRQINVAQRQSVFANAMPDVMREPVIMLIVSIGLYLVYTYSSQSFSAIIILVFLFNRVMTRFTMLQKNYQAMVNSEAVFWSLLETIEDAEDHNEPEVETPTAPTLNNSLEIDRLSFSYGDHTVLNDVSLSVHAGEFVALVGPSGAGKTTLVDLMLGFYQPSSGEIRVDGVPLDKINRHAWRKLIGYVPQEMFLFHESIYKNVTLGDEEISRQQVEQALASAGIGDFIADLPDGIDTVVGERGSKLSGGQRQRIALARAIVHKPRLLILDEVTASLDPKTEAEICATLQSLQGDVTIISVSHQPALVAAADVVYRIHDGSVSQVQNHEINVEQDDAGIDK